MPEYVTARLQDLLNKERNLLSGKRVAVQDIPPRRFFSLY